jgi:hypothetical protein
MSLLDPVAQRPEAGRQAEALVVDLAGVTFVTPFALVTLAALVARRDGGAPVRVVCPSHADCRQYLAVSGFLQQITMFVTVDGADGLLWAAPSWGANTVLPLTRLDNGTALQALRGRVQERLVTMLGAHEQQRRREIAPILSTILEACTNVFEHANYPVVWLAAQRYVNSFTGAAYVEIAIADAGRGIKESLVTRLVHLRPVADGEAIERMLTEGLSRFEESYRGNGYQLLQEATRERDGSFFLRSGNGAVSHPRRSGLRREGFGSRWPGTQLAVRLTCS